MTKWYVMKSSEREERRMTKTRSDILILMGLAVVLLFPQGSEASSSREKPISPSALFKDLEYRCIGPTRGGRVTAVAGVPGRPAVFYMGAVGGGVWKTTDSGHTWKNVSDGFFATGSIGAIRVAPSNPDIVYAGTGSDAIRSNVITGRGLYKSTDAGRTWVFLGLRDIGQTGAVEIHPDDPEIVFVAALGHAFGPNPERGVYRTLDGGGSWERMLFLSDEIGAADLELAPGDPDTIYAGMWRAERKPWTIISGGREGGIYKSVDGGGTWKPLTRGLPDGLRGKCDLAVSPADPERVYVLMEAPEPKGGIYRSDDRGESFRLVSSNPRLLDRPFYYGNLDADPADADTLFVNSTGFYKSTDAGKTWKRRSTPHGDNHDMWINPQDSNIFIQSNDGGANITLDGGRTWSTQFNQPTAELYQVEVDDQFPYWIYAGQQDNSTIMVPSLPPYSPAAGAMGFWRAVGGCETGPAVPKPGDPDIVYSNCKGRFGRYNKRTRQEKQYYVGAANMYGHNPRDLAYRFQRVSPIHVSPHDPDTVYHASQYLHRTRDEGVTWERISPDLTANRPDRQVISGGPITRDITGEEFYSTLYAVRESPLEPGLIWVGANDGPVHVTRDGGRTWTDVTPEGLPPGGRVQTVEPSPHRPGKAFVAVYRFLLDDWQPYIYRTMDYGKSWVRLTSGDNGIPPDSPTRVVREDPDREGLLFAGTEFGIYLSFDDGETWRSFQFNLPVTPVTDIRIHRKDLVLSTMGRSFWILDDLTPLHQIDPDAASDLLLFEPREAVRMRYRSSTRSGADPAYPPPGARIDYMLPADVEDIELTITRPDGREIRRFSGTRGIPRLKRKAGIHRFLWDMRHGIQTGDSGEENPYRRRRGPLVSPGSYRATLRVDGRSRTADFDIQADPRILEDGVTLSDLKAQERLCLEVLELGGRARKAADRIEKLLLRMADNPESGVERTRPARKRDEELSELQARLVTAPGRYRQPKLIDQIQYLYGMLDRADQKPGRDAFSRLKELKEALDDLESDLERISDHLK